jgi:hypothetical protein
LKNMEIELNGYTYRIGKLNAMDQFHVSRRIAPIIPTLIPVFLKLAQGGGLTGNLSALGDALQPFAEGISTMSDEASEFVLSTCLSVVHRQTGQTWAPVWSRQHKASMFEDMDLSVLLNLAIRVIKDSMEPFIRGLVTSGAQANP